MKLLSFIVVFFAASKVYCQEGHWYQFQIGVTGVSQGDAFNDSFSLDLHWTPSLSHGDFTVRGDLGFSILEDLHSSATAKQKFASFSYQAFAEVILIDNLVGAIGGGFQSWLERESLKPIASTQLSLLVVEVPLVTRLTMGLSRFFASTPAWQWNFGFGLRFD